ncbi:TasA family protein [Blastococcus litoris]|uniref:TasA family protein n=1 Tax=Blastococcus litoris TaxID=2171622 RepID=UPI000E306BC8|nr:TasA family protein [Blastococcus litoris]
MSTKTIAKSSTARKVVGSLGVLGAAAAVAGMGTFGSFTDSTAPVTTTVASGTVDINLAQVGTAIPVTTAGFVPGDSLTRTVNLSNDGTSALGSVVLNTTVTTPSVLTTDITNGLQLSVKSCSVAWSATYTCGGTERLLAAGPVTSQMTLTNPASLAAGATDNLALTISLPSSADNTFQGKTAALSLTFTGTQRTGTTR